MSPAPPARAGPVASIPLPSAARAGCRFRHGRPSGHDDDGGPVDHGLGVRGGALVVADQAAVAHQPAESPLDDPAAAQDLEGMRLVRATTSTVIAATALAYRASGAPLYPVSAHMIFRVLNTLDGLMSGGCAQALSLMLAAVTARADRSQPSASTARCRPRPSIFFPPWYPRVFRPAVSSGLDDLGIGDVSRRLRGPALVLGQRIPQAGGSARAAGRGCSTVQRTRRPPPRAGNQPGGPATRCRS